MTTPEQGIFGPARFIVAEPEINISGASDTMPDCVQMILGLRGTNSRGESVTGGPRISGLPDVGVDCNIVTQGVWASMNAAWNAIFPFVINLNSVNLTRSIIHRPELFPPETVAAPDLQLSNRVGIMIDRVLDRGQCRPSRPNGNGTEPTI